MKIKFFLFVSIVFLALSMSQNLQAITTTQQWSATEALVEQSIDHIERLEAEIDRSLADPELAAALSAYRAQDGSVEKAQFAQEKLPALIELGRKMDTLTQAEFDALIAITSASAQEIADSPSSALQAAKINPIIERLKLNEQDYLQSEGLYGQAKDFKRFNAFHSYMKDYLELLDTAAIFKPRPTVLASAMIGLRKILRQSIDLVRVGTRVLKPVLKLCYAVYFQAKTGPGKTPIDTDALEIFSKWEKFRV